MLIKDKKLSYNDARYLLYFQFKIKVQQNGYDEIILPNGWYYKIVSAKKYFIIDEHKRIRGEFIIKNPKNRIGKIKLYTRYYVRYEKPYISIYDRKNDKIMIETKIRPFEKWEMKKSLELYLDKVYSDWRIPINYWS